MGCGGIYFRHTLPHPSISGGKRIPSEVPGKNDSGIEFKEIESGSVSQMVDSSSAALLEEINSKAKKPLIWPWVLGSSLSLLALLLQTGVAAWVYTLFIPLFSGGMVWATHADKMRKTVVLFYELDPPVEQAFQNLHNAFDTLRGCSMVWHIESQGNITSTYDRKVNAGATALLKRKTITPRVGSPPYFQCNLAIPMLPAGRQRLFILPDRVLVWDTNGVGAVGFEELEIDFSDERFLENGGIPGDAKIVDRTWQYVNKAGGPDRRFKDNREIPIVLYERMQLTSRSGLQESFQTSRSGIGVVINSAIRQMALEVSRTRQSETLGDYVKCPCAYCDIYIEFPAHGIGQTVTCPHCGLETTLFKPATGCA